MHRTHYLHGCYGAVPLMTLIAPIARVSRSTNRSTPHQADSRMQATERHRRLGQASRGYGRRATWSIWTTRRSSSIV
jgi:1,2-phenylacetyl-CoA epoxidase PaaB subunit